MSPPLIVTFAGGADGPWRIDSMNVLAGDGLPMAERLVVAEGRDPEPSDPLAWRLRAVVSNARYTNRREVDALKSRQEALLRPDATCAALIPIRKTAAWWALAQDERRAIIEEGSRHISIGLEYLPAIARRLHHGRELGEPFDFLTWFEFAPAHAPAFDELVRRLRSTEEWDYVEREIDLRLTRPSPDNSGRAHV